MTPAAAALTFFLQMAVIIAACRVTGWAARRWLGQPQVVGEMIAGVLLGPSLFGWLAPAAQAFVFPEQSRTILYVGAQVGVGLYMFLVGLGFDRAEFARSARGAAAVSIGGMVAPFIAAVVLVLWLLPNDRLFAAHVAEWQAMLFLGSAMAITAFPMLARIIHERGISGSRLGTLSLSAGAIGDAGAWVVIALLLASLGDGPAVAVKAVVGGIGFAMFMLIIAPRLLRRMANMVDPAGNIGDGALALVLILFLLSAWAMELAGIHAVFGGFLLGIAMPRGPFAAALRARLEPFAVTFLLPMFFTYSGLHTDLTVVGDASLIGAGLVIIAASVLAKGGACYVAARASGEDHATAMGIGALMNARGLMELIIINLGLERGIITPPLFAILVLMAVVTTLMASPLFEAVYGRRARRDGALVSGT